MAWDHNRKPPSGIPASGIPAGGPGLHGPAQHLPKAAAFTSANQPAPEAKSAGHQVRAEFRRKLAEKLDKVDAVYEAALAHEDPRVGLVAAKQISVELWGAPTQAVTGEDGGPLAVVIRRFVEDVPE